MKTFVLRILLPITLIFTISTCSTEELYGVTPTKLAVAKPNDVEFEYSVGESELIRMINDYRISKGLNELELSNYVSVKAQEHNMYMIQNNVVSHAGFKERADDIIKVLGAKKVNENIAYNFATNESAIEAWLRSSGHKANLEGDFDHFGISIVVNPENGKKYYTSIFIKL